VPTAVSLFALLIVNATVAVGQLLFKHLGLSIRGLPLADAAATLARQPELYAALALYGAATLLWIWILGRMPLMLAYPWVGVAAIVVPLLSSYFFSEQVGPLFWLGAALIALGIALTQWAGRGG
jgi:drug/metabolite transporter (DMT)-like permease